MLRLSVAILALGLLFTACGGGAAAGASPADTFAAAQAAMKAKDWGGFFDLVSPAAMEEMEEGLKQLKGLPEEGRGPVCEQFGIDPDALDSLTIKDFFVAVMEKQSVSEDEDFQKMLNAEFVGAEVKDGKAEVKFKAGDEEDTMEMVQVDGKWYIADFD